MLELMLAAALAYACWEIVKLQRKLLIVRHLFVRSSDECAQIIMEMRKAAIAQAAFETGQSEDDAQNDVSWTILDGMTLWEEQASSFQATLRRNGIRPLRDDDLHRFTFDRPTWYN